MQVRETVEQGITVIALEGRLDAPAAPEAEKAFKKAIDSDASRVVLDLAGVEYISSGGLRVAIMLLKALEKNGGRLILCGLSPFVSEVFELTHLSQRFAICSSRNDALTLLLK